MLKYSAPAKRKLLVLDYFADGYRFGIKPTGYDRTSVGYAKDTDANNLDYFNHSKTFPDGIPYGIFDGVAGEKYLTYDFSEYVSDTDIVTVEFIAKIPSSSSFYALANTRLGAEVSLIALMSYNNQLLCGHNTRSSTWDYPATFFPSYPLFTGSNTYTTTWHRYRMTKFGGILYCISDVGGTYRVIDIVESQMTKFQLLNCIVNANNYDEKLGSYQITQLAIYKWIDAMPPIDLSTTLWVDTPECPKEKWSME